jgi:LPXTG-motif cell wall-anchored protein
MWTRSRRAAAIAAVIACLTASPALAQDPNLESNLGSEPPVALSDGSSSGREGGGRPAVQLANTGAEPILFTAAGLGLLLAGAGLRLRVLPPAREH